MKVACETALRRGYLGNYTCLAVRKRNADDVGGPAWRSIYDDVTSLSLGGQYGFTVSIQLFETEGGLRWPALVKDPMGCACSTLTFKKNGSTGNFSPRVQNIV